MPLDLFSLGAIFFEYADGPRSVSGRIVWRDSALRFAGLAPGAQRVTGNCGHGKIVHRALEREPQDRYASARAWPRSCAPPALRWLPETVG